MTAGTTSTQLLKNGLSEDQLLHFSEHGWLVLDGVLSAAECQVYIDHIERCLDLLSHTDETIFYAGRDFTAPYVYQSFFLRWFKIPGITQACRQLIGTKSIRVSNQRAVNNLPHPDRHARRLEVADWSTWNWHRDFGPQWGIARDTHNPRLVNSLSVTCATYLTPASAEDGSTAFLDGSHLEGGGYPELRNGERIVQPDVGQGSIVIFSEAIWHTTAPILSDRPRYALLTWMSGSWLSRDLTHYQPLAYADRLLDDDLRELFSPTTGNDLSDARQALRRHGHVMELDERG